MQEELFSYAIEEFKCDDDIAGTENFTVGADTPFVGAIIGGVTAGLVAEAIIEVVN